MKVFIITEGNRQVGFGHLTRCLSLYQAFEEKKIKSHLVIKENDCLENLLNGVNYIIFNWLKERERLSELLKKADAAIIDSYLSDISFYENFSNLVKTPVYIEDYKKCDYPKGIIINGNIHAEELDYSDRNGVIYLLGTKYTPLRKEFWNVPKKEIRKKVECIMVTFGGNDIKNLTPKILRLLKERFFSINKNVVLGKGFQNIDEIEKEADKKINLIYYPNAEKMKEIMLESDLAISAGGQTLYELARVGVPTIGIAVADNQLNNLKGWLKEGFIEYAGWWSDKELLHNISLDLILLSDYELRNKKSKSGTKMVDGLGAHRIIKNIIESLK